MGPSASNSGPQAEQARHQQCRYTQDRIIRHCNSRLEDVAPRRRPTIGVSLMTVKRARTIVTGVPVEKRTGKGGKQRKMPRNPLFDPLGLGRSDLCPQRKQFPARCASTERSIF
jgi:hypothetical protein